MPGTIATASEPQEWREVKNSSGIQVYSAQSFDTPIIKGRAVALLDVRLDQVVAVLNDETRYTNWVPYLSDVKILQADATTEKLVYNRFDAPWPIRDRDLFYRVVVRSQTESQLSYVMQSETDPRFPEREGVVRANLMESSYLLTAADESQTRVEVIFHADPSGHLPLWIVNFVQRSFPYDAIKGLRKELNEMTAD